MRIASTLSRPAVAGLICALDILISSIYTNDKQYNRRKEANTKKEELWLK